MDLKRLGSIDACLRHVTTAVSTARLYNVEHAQVRKLCQMAHASLLEAMGEDYAMALLRIDEQIAIDEHPLARSMYIQRFARLLKMNGIGHIKFLQNVSAEELHALIASLSATEKVTHSSENLRLGQVEVRHRVKSGSNEQWGVAGVSGPGSAVQDLSERADSGKGLLPGSAQILEDVSSEELARVMEVYEAVSNNRRLHVVGLSEIVGGFISVLADYADPLLTLVPLRNMDEYTFTHSLNVCLLNLAQATALGIEGQRLHDIGLSAMLHDVGKLFIPNEILNKAGPLDDFEWGLMKAHPVRGAEYLLDNPGVPRMAVVSAYEHHMRFDLRGYPKVKSQWQQNLCSHITSISDLYDSERTWRPYRGCVEPQAVLTTIEQLKGTQLHPQLAENFLRLMKKSSLLSANNKGQGEKQ
jgi:HD-GYP domain-containing protein (c-di-GMP phosphodiesterase class II)